ncbi:type IV secretory system conjugative DNA transfer family protein [Roseibium sp. RKSG952]|uniref:type IV secretory system conjugative DNA transfer family protein n=1 Tax=Roseibium sp. RKSG952 TaxID=2529384 RepID=UPI0012BB49CB|nr:type IV secretory system conjugative DNA transfer family protein [Roseibium sp. RKSG952]MTH95711.1 hypothetical protein [Roseibium sp. RKSG952]
MRTKLISAALLASMLGGCNHFGHLEAPMPISSPASDAQLRADVNAERVPDPIAAKTPPAASLNEILAKTGRVHKREKPKDAEDKLRAPAMQEAAMAFGARAGLAHATREINLELSSDSKNLNEVYDFQSLMIIGPNGVMVQPPVISEARDTWESFDAGKTLRVADTVYEIIEQARFTSVAPMWQTYLVTGYDEPKTPPTALLPSSDDEVSAWNEWVREGWGSGKEQARKIFETNLNRLNRDFGGMVRYKTLVEEGRVSPAILAEGNLGTTGTGQDLRVNDRAIRITRDPSLVANPNSWEASPTRVDERGTVRGVSETERAVPVPAKPRTPPETIPKKPSRPAPVRNVDAVTSGGDGRF